ncbi:PepSY domain-containing protein [Segnochrobactraceae bacterium EtOH-i3]
MTIRTVRIVAAVALASLVPGSAGAAPKCTSDPPDKWLSVAEMKVRAVELGYRDIRAVRIVESCYEIQARTPDDRKADVLFNPVTGDVVKAEIGG